jgi:hypothetical protein
MIDKPSAALCPEPYRVAKTVSHFVAEQSIAETRGSRAGIFGNLPDDRGEIVQRSLKRYRTACSKNLTGRSA